MNVIGGEKTYTIEQSQKEKQLQKKIALGIEEEKENDFELKMKFDEMEDDKYNDDYDDQVKI